MPKCSNCHIELDGIKLSIHEKYCIENMKYCETCKQAIPKEEFEEHLNGHLSRQQSKEIKNEEKKEDQIEKEKDQFLHKMSSEKISCQYCGDFKSLDLLKEHEEMCGARTENCIYCNKLITRKNMKKHLEDCQKQNKNNNDLQHLTSSDLYKLDEDEQIARAMQESLNDIPKNNNNLNNNKDYSNNYYYKQSIDNNNLNYQKSLNSLQSGEIDYEYEKQMEEDFYNEQIKQWENEEMKKNK